MSQSTPTAVTKRKVMGRMDAGPSEPTSNSVTPTARPRIIRAQHGYSSSSISNNATPTATRPTPGTGRARVDMSAFSSPSTAASSPLASPSLNGRPVSASAAASNTFTARLTAPSPTVRSTPAFHARSGSVVGANVGTSPYRLNEARIDASGDPNLVPMRSPRVRARNGSVDLGGGSPAVTSPSMRVSTASAQISLSTSTRSPLPRADQSSLQKPSTPSAFVRPAALNRNLLSPQRSQEILEPDARISTSRPPSPTKSPASPAPSATGFPQPASPAKPHLYTRGSDPTVPGRQAPLSGAVPIVVANPDLSRTPSTFNGTVAPADEQALYATSPSESRPFASTAGPNRIEPGSAMTTGRAGLRPVPASQRSSIPPSFMDLTSIAPSAASRSDTEQRALLVSGSFPVYSGARQPLSPSSETPLSPSEADEAGEAEEARIHRKLLDLEITNKSLLAINSALEVTKLKQAKEIRELKRRLRDGRGLPCSVTTRESSSIVLSDDDLLSDSDNEELLSLQEDPELEAAHQRCKDLVDLMVERARKAIMAKYEEENAGGGGKVLHPAELEEMQREMDEEAEDARTEADTTTATDALEVSMTFDTDNADVDEGLRSSSSLMFGAHAGCESIADSAPSTTLHPDSARASRPVPGDVSID